MKPKVAKIARRNLIEKGPALALAKCNPEVRVLDCVMIKLQCKKSVSDSHRSGFACFFAVQCRKDALVTPELIASKAKKMVTDSSSCWLQHSLAFIDTEKSRRLFTQMGYGCRALWSRM
jgi:hypothetical protein